AEAPLDLGYVVGPVFTYFEERFHLQPCKPRQHLCYTGGEVRRPCLRGIHPEIAGLHLTRFAQFITVCSTSILAETRGYAVSFSSRWRGKRCIFEQCKPVFMG